MSANLEYEQQRIDWYNAGSGRLNEIDGYNCDICKNKGIIAKLTENGEWYTSDCECQKIRNSLKIAQKSGLGEIITTYTFDNFLADEKWQLEIKRKALDFCNDADAKCFYIGGQVGCGKTHICTAIAAHYIKAGANVKYMLWCDESKHLKAIANDSCYQEEIKKYKSVDVLYIDDFLKVQNGSAPSDADIKLAFEIINNRIIDNKKTTIISSEKALDELIDYDEATMSRIYQKSKNYKITIAKDRSKNYRLK